MIVAHAASVGETIAIVPLIESILDLGVNVVLTTGTVTSAQVAEERLGDRIIHQFVPLDLKPAITRFLNHWQPDLAIIAESEIWPMTIMELGLRRIPQVLVNVKVANKRPLDALPSVTALIERFERELGTDGRVLVRYSGTEAKVRVMVEGPDEVRINGYAQEIASALAVACAS